MEDFESFYESAVNRILPPAVVCIVNGKGEQLYHRAFGTVPTDQGDQQITTDAVFQFASCTKLITTIAALQCVERGLLSLDGDISDILPELRDLGILVGYDDHGQPVLEKNERTITLRQLLTHSSGSHDDEDPLLARYIKEENVKSDRSVTGRWLRPLRYEPGHGWWYSGGLDWAGKAIERVSGNIRLDEYMQQHIFQPLSIKRLGFQLADGPDLAKDLTQLWNRDSSGQLVSVKNELWTAWGKPDDLGGGGLYGTAADYAKIQAAILHNDGSLLGPDTVETMFEPQLEDGKYLEAWVKNLPERDSNAVLQTIAAGSRLNFGLGGLMNLYSIPRGRAAHSLSWGGAWGAAWWIDPENDIAGFFVTAFETYGDPAITEASNAFVRAAYNTFSRNG